MFFNRKQKFFFSHDVHSHILYGVDDGAKTLEDSVGLVKDLSSLGITTISATSHINRGKYDNDLNTLTPKLEDIRKAVRDNDIAVEILPGAEYRISDTLPEALDREIIPFWKNYVLVEFSLISRSSYFEAVISKLKDKGYIPVLAHPERYKYFHDDMFSHCTAIKRRGCLLQVNILSLAGFYGHSTEKAAWDIIKEGMVDFLGTDMHSKSYFDALKEFMYSSAAGKLNNYDFLNK